MPELPEVETIVRGLAPSLVGRTIVHAEVHWARTLATPPVKKFKEQVRGQKILAVTRRAKYFILRLQDYNLLIHLRMSGDLMVRRSRIEREPHDRLALSLHGENGLESLLVFNDTRKFGRVWLTDQPESILGKLGPEPLERSFTAQWLYENLRQRKRQLKPLLLDQTFIAGLGNIYTDECLHIAKLHPLKLSNTVSQEQAGTLREAIRSVLKEGIRRNGASIDWVYRGGEYQNYFRVYDRDGEPCPVCGAEIQKLTVGQRGTHICPRCQPLKPNERK
jgi:formamidopyrimidine-DNA glycosylase